VLVVAGRSDRASGALRAGLGEAGVTSAAFHVAGEPSVETARAATEAAREVGAAGIVAVGGGSALDTGKAAAALLSNCPPGAPVDPAEFLEVVGRGQPLTRPSAPFIAVPTTAGVGAEVTRNAVLKCGPQKVSMRSPFMVPDMAIVDPDLTLSCPADVTAACGLDALVQCLEPFISGQANPASDAFARPGLALGARHLARAFADGGDAEAREGMCLCSLYSGLALAHAKLGAVHGFAGVVGGMFESPHGAVCGALLPPCWEANWVQVREEGGAARDRFEEAARVLGAEGAGDGTPEGALAWMRALVAELGVPGLGAYGLREEHVAEVVAKSAASSSMQGNPVVLSDEALAQALRQAM